MAEYHAIPWYRQEDYPAVFQIMDDTEPIPVPYHRWREGAELVEAREKAAGKTVVRVIINADEFKAWCAERKMRLDSAARMQFVREKAASRRNNTD